MHYRDFWTYCPKTLPEFIATVQNADHPNYKVLVVDGTNAAVFNVGDRVYINWK